MFTRCISFVSYIKPQQNNFKICIRAVVYLSFPTSNHNSGGCCGQSLELYIFRFLHQTTTIFEYFENPSGCISFVSYIKPQQTDEHKARTYVVYLSFPTSNHNSGGCCGQSLELYIFRFLHQTTTKIATGMPMSRCISFVSYIKPQPGLVLLSLPRVVYLSFPTSNHNY